MGDLVTDETPFDNGEPRVIDVYNSDDWLGSVCVGLTIRAVTPDGVEIGTFPTIEEARAAVVRAAFQSSQNPAAAAG